MTMEIALAFRDKDGTYIAHVSAMLASVLASSTHAMRIHILHDETLSPENAAHLHSLCGMGQELIFHPINPKLCLGSLREDSPIMKPLTLATLYRLFLPKLSGLEQCSRLIYLDTDLIVDTDLWEMWTVDMGTALLAAVPDPCLHKALENMGQGHKDQWARKVAQYSAELGIPTERYFNAGVLLLDLDGIRREGLFDQALRMVWKEPRLFHPDRDAINKLFFHKIVFLSQKCNYIVLITE